MWHEVNLIIDELILSFSSFFKFYTIFEIFKSMNDKEKYNYDTNKILAGNV